MTVEERPSQMGQEKKVSSETRGATVAVDDCRGLGSARRQGRLEEQKRGGSRKPRQPGVAVLSIRLAQGFELGMRDRGPVAVDAPLPLVHSQSLPLSSLYASKTSCPQLVCARAPSHMMVRMRMVFRS